MTPRERVARTLARQPVDRVPKFDWFWDETARDFKAQLGAKYTDKAATVCIGDKFGTPDTYTLWEYYDFDLMQVAWPDQRLRMIPPEVLEETDEWVLVRDGNWADLRWWKHKMGTPEHLGFGIDTPEKWYAVKHLLEPSRDRIRFEEFAPRYHRAKAAGKYICFTGVEVIESVKDTLGHEMLCKAMIRYPDWIRDVLDTYAQFEIDTFKLFEAEGFVCDGAFIYGDIAYKNGPFMSPRHYREFVFPAHKRFFDEFHKRNMPVIFHSDGDIRKLLPHFVEAGINMINPLESRAGMDIRELAPEWGDRLGFCGNIDVTVLATNDRAKIRYEVESKLRAGMAKRGVMYHSDHSIPPGVTLDTYHYVLALVDEIGKYD
jgi:uroporphyrinogen decarboxylase